MNEKSLLPHNQDSRWRQNEAEWAYILLVLDVNQYIVRLLFPFCQLATIYLLSRLAKLSIVKITLSPNQIAAGGYCFALPNDVRSPHIFR